MTTTDAIFYSLPANRLVAGMSTADGQDITNVWLDHERKLVGYDTYTPRPDDPGQDADNQCAPDGRIATWDEPVDLAVFADTEIDGRETP